MLTKADKFRFFVKHYVVNASQRTICFWDLINKWFYNPNKGLATKTPRTPRKTFNGETLRNAELGEKCLKPFCFRFRTKQQGWLLKFSASLRLCVKFFDFFGALDDWLSS